MSRTDSPSEIVDLVSLLQDRFGWEATAETYEVVNRWERPRSGSVFFRLAGHPDGPQLVVKVRRDWSEGTAEHVHLATNRLAETVAHAGLAHGRVVRSMGWATDPETVVMPYVEGLDLVSVLRTPTHWAWQGNGAILSACMADAGAMLAAFHDTEPEEPPGFMPTDAEARAIAARVKASKQIAIALDSIDLGSRFRLSFGDYGPGNLHLTEDRLLYVLDAPESPEHALIHRDQAHFLFETRRQLAGHGYTRTAPVTGQYGRLASAFLNGYSNARSGIELNGADESLIDLYQLRRVVGMVRKRLPGRPSDAWWFARTALSLRVGLGRSPGRVQGPA